jgi:multicomponent Na+:H+ antiporter subunit E
MTHVLTAAFGCGLLYALTLASTDPIDFGTGAVLGGALVWVFGRSLQRTVTGPRPPLWRRIAWFPVFAGAIVADAVVGTWDVALRVLGVRSFDAQGFVRVPIGERSERGLAVSALTITLSPGSVLIDVDPERGEMLFHEIDASDPDAVRARYQRFYDRYQRRVFP